jgi:hypothetical protein
MSWVLNSISDAVSTAASNFSKPVPRGTTAYRVYLLSRRISNLADDGEQYVKEIRFPFPTSDDRRWIYDRFKVVLHASSFACDRVAHAMSLCGNIFGSKMGQKINIQAASIQSGQVYSEEELENLSEVSKLEEALLKEYAEAVEEAKSVTSGISNNIAAVDKKIKLVQIVLAHFLERVKNNQDKVDRFIRLQTQLLETQREIEKILEETKEVNALIAEETAALKQINPKMTSLDTREQQLSSVTTSPTPKKQHGFHSTRSISVQS